MGFPAELPAEFKGALLQLQNDVGYLQNPDAANRKKGIDKMEETIKILGSSVRTSELPETKLLLKQFAELKSDPNYGNPEKGLLIRTTVSELSNKIIGNKQILSQETPQERILKERMKTNFLSLEKICQSIADNPNQAPAFLNLMDKVINQFSQDNPDLYESLKEHSDLIHRYFDSIDTVQDNVAKGDLRTTPQDLGALIGSQLAAIKQIAQSYRNIA